MNIHEGFGGEDVKDYAGIQPVLSLFVSAMKMQEVPHTHTHTHTVTQRVFTVNGGHVQSVLKSLKYANYNTNAHDHKEKKKRE